MTQNIVPSLLLTCAALVSCSVSAASPPLNDADFAGEVARQTTDPRFLPEWMASLPDHPTVPSPQRHFGYIVGAEGKLTGVDEMHAYFRALAATSTRAKLFSFGMSDEGREGLVLAIADEDTIQRLDEYKEMLRALADARVTDAQTAAKLIGQAKPIYWVKGGLHSDELGPPEMTMELAYRLITEEREPFSSIRSNVITLITPIVEVDGRLRQVEWTRRVMRGQMSWVDRPPNASPYWGKYVHHDNNRDAIAISQKVTQNFADRFFEWLPTVSLDLHETIPLLYVFSGTGPYNEAYDGSTVADWHLLANYEVTRLTAFGMPGVWSWGYVDGWHPGFISSLPNTHNAIGRFFETFGTSTLDTIDVDVSHKMYVDKSVVTKQWYRQTPPPRKFRWSMRNNVNYMQSGVLASLEAVANNSRMLLTNFHERGAKAIRAGREEAPHAFVIPSAQRDPAAASHLLGILRRQRIEVSTPAAPSRIGDLELRAGDVVVRLDQPYGKLARTLFEKQKMPSEQKTASYDDAAWTLGLLLGVDVRPVADPAILQTALSSLPVDSDPFTAQVPASGAVWVVPHQAQQNLGPWRFAMAGTTVRAARVAFEAEGRTFPAGSYLIRQQEVKGASLGDSLGDSLQRFKLHAVTLAAMPEVPTHDLDLPRLAVLHSWLSTKEAGWVRFDFDRAKIPYTLIDDAALRRGALRKRFDVILMPSITPRLSGLQLIQGVDSRWGPLPYRGGISNSPDITGGFGFAGLAALKQFVEAGGTLVTLENGGMLVGETGLSRQIRAERPTALNTPGSIVTAKILDRASPLTYGYDTLTHVLRRQGPLYKVADYRQDLVVMQFGTLAGARTGIPAERPTDTTPPLVISGGILGGEDLVMGAPALLSESVGKGRIVVFGWNPLYRDLNHHQHAFLYNALLQWNDLGGGAR